MISLVIYGVIAIGLASAAGYAFLTFTNVSRQTTQLQENQVRMETAASALRAAMLALNGNGTVFVPDGVAGPSYTQLPATLGVISAAPWGQPYLYCPMSLTGATNPLTGTANTVTYPGGSYSVTDYSGPITQGLPYVITSPTSVIGGGSAASTGYVAFIVSTTGPGQTMPACSSITYVAPGASVLNPYGGISVPNGVVRGVTANFPFTQRVIASTDRTELYVGQASTGNGTGQDVNNQTTLDNAFLIWQSLQPRLTEIYLTPGGSGYSSANNLDLEPTRAYAQGENTSLVIGTTPGASGQAALTLTSSLRITGKTTFDNVAVTPASGATQYVYQPLTFRNSTYSGGQNTMRVYNTTLTVSDSTMNYVTVGGSNSNVEFYNYANSSSTFTNLSIAGSAMHVGFDGAIASIYTFNNGSGIPALAMTLGSVNLSAGMTLKITSTQTPGIILSGAQFNDSGALTIATSDSSYTGRAYTGGAIEDIDGSSVVIASGATAYLASNGTLDNGIYVRGSSLAVNGALQAYNVANGNVGAQGATLTGNSTAYLYVSDNTTPCIQFPNQAIEGTNPFTTLPYYPIFGNTNSSFPNNPLFGQIKNGMAPLLYPAITSVASNVFDTTIAANLVYNSAPSAPGLAGTDPYIAIAAQPVYPASYALDKYSFEAGVRQIVNSEYLNPGTMAFDGSCASYQ